eukprot:GAHX01003290.1.p1 GENE.GAHX01003290.1~~GAHX01003290.1.p1  ORF type:complete len:449 (-),score=68.77 GAHX01003290.1:109-1455(-)
MKISSPNVHIILIFWITSVLGSGRPDTHDLLFLADKRSFTFDYSNEFLSGNIQVLVGIKGISLLQPENPYQALINESIFNEISFSLTPGCSDNEAKTETCSPMLLSTTNGSLVLVQSTREERLMETAPIEFLHDVVDEKSGFNINKSVSIFKIYSDIFGDNLGSNYIELKLEFKGDRQSINGYLSFTLETLFINGKEATEVAPTPSSKKGIKETVGYLWNKIKSIPDLMNYDLYEKHLQVVKGFMISEIIQKKEIESVLEGDNKLETFPTFNYVIPQQNNGQMEVLEPHFVHIKEFQRLICASFNILKCSSFDLNADTFVDSTEELQPNNKERNNSTTSKDKSNTEDNTPSGTHSNEKNNRNINKSRTKHKDTPEEIKGTLESKNKDKQTSTSTKTSESNFGKRKRDIIISISVLSGVLIIGLIVLLIAFSKKNDRVRVSNGTHGGIN